MTTYPRHMTELDQEWSQLLDAATARAHAAGRHDVAAYLKLKATNDAIRKVGCTWLFNTFIEIASDLRVGAAIAIERRTAQFCSRFVHKVGSRLMSVSVRCLSIEAGWARVPRTG